MNSKIISFLKEEYILTLATCINNKPQCANCFYVFSGEYTSIFFKSDKTTRHILEALKNNQVAGTILPSKNEENKIIGLQFTGIFFEPKEKKLTDAKKEYYYRFPYARLVGGDFYGIELLYMKYTDYRLGFGKKLLWDKT